MHACEVRARTDTGSSRGLFWPRARVWDSSECMRWRIQSTLTSRLLAFIPPMVPGCRARLWLCRWACRRLRHTVLTLATVSMSVVALLYLLLGRIVFGDPGHDQKSLASPWHYQCDGGLCKKVEITDNTTSPLALSVCQLFCGYGAVWPQPTGHMSLGNHVAKLDSDDVVLNGVDRYSYVGQLLQENVERLKSNIRSLTRSIPLTKGYGLTINVISDFDVNSAKLTLSTPESYTLKIHKGENGRILADLSGPSYFGIRHGLETLSQLIVYDDLRGDVKIARDVYISDEPAFAYRGILLDTSRNFIDKASILRTIDGMAMSKLNSFHWHITDSHSFPYVSRTWPKLSKYGAYAPNKIYSEEDIQEIVRYGLVRGVRVLPELDAPAHVGEGWQWVSHEATVCFKAEPWRDYCVEPPCGQLNPTSEKVYEILEGIYTDMLKDFQPDFFHMGGDEVNIDCWNSSNVIKNWMLEHGWDLSEPSFYKLWDYFQSRAYEKLLKANNGTELDVVLWTSGLTKEENIKLLNPAKYIIQIWTTGLDRTIGRLVKNNFRVIFSNYDALYFDCGFGAWIGEGTNWCSPYKGWQKVYDNSPMRILEKQGFSHHYKHLVLGAEAALWSEQVDTASVDSRLWPRSAAMAERLWSNPNASWIHAEQRLLKHRERMVQRGILADSLEPEWCLQNQGYCYA